MTNYEKLLRAIWGFREAEGDLPREVMPTHHTRLMLKLCLGHGGPSHSFWLPSAKSSFEGKPSMNRYVVDPRTGKRIKVLWWDGKSPNLCGICREAKAVKDIYMARRTVMIFACAGCASKLRAVSRAVTWLLALGVLLLLWKLLR